MINFYSENDFELQHSTQFKTWIKEVIASEGKKTGEISFIFCDDEYLLEINQQYLDHDTYTDI
ncbi:rRNA maturation factor, partial [Tamlana crocina]|nr:rRNA maturation factor [Tamlana crocina]